MSENLADTDEFAPVDSPPPPAPPRSAAARTVVDLAALTDTGSVRTNNEDVFLAVRGYRALQTLWTNLPADQVPLRSEEGGYGMLVADGMGGAVAGEVASRMAATTLVGLVLDTPDWIMKIGTWEADEVLSRIADRYRQVHAALKEEAAANPELVGMGTTMTVAHNIGRDLFVGHVGDSRAYLCRGGDLIRLTRDHTYAQELVDMGVIAPDQVMTHHFRHVLTRALGEGGPQLEADVQRVRLSDGDQVLLCTDGLTDMVDDASIGQLLRKAVTASDACHDLVGLALANGGRDNVTVVLARYQFVRES
jgi:PPM family protein phosphatase